MDLSTIDPLWIWIALGAVGVLIVAGLFARGARRSRTDSLRDTFGSEYDHAVKTHGRSKGEQDLITRAEEVKNVEIRPLTASEVSRYRDEWTRVEARFVERPTTAVVEAEELIGGIMREQGYPLGDFDRHAAHLSVKHPRVVEHYRLGHAAIDANKDGRSTTEELRQAMLHFRRLINELLGAGAGSDVVRDVPTAREIESEEPRPLRPGEGIRDEERLR